MLLVAGFLSSLIFFFPSFVTTLLGIRHLLQRSRMNSSKVSSRKQPRFYPALTRTLLEFISRAVKATNCRGIAEPFHTHVTFTSAMLLDSFTKTLLLAHTDMVIEEVNEDFSFLWYFVWKWIFETNFRTACGLHVSSLKCKCVMRCGARTGLGLDSVSIPQRFSLVSAFYTLVWYMIWCRFRSSRLQHCLLLEKQEMG